MTRTVGQELETRMTEENRGSKRDVVYLGWQIAPSYMSGGESGSCGVSANEYSCAHGAQINLGDLTPYLTYGGEGLTRTPKKLAGGRKMCEWDEYKRGWEECSALISFDHPFTKLVSLCELKFWWTSKICLRHSLVKHDLSLSPPLLHFLKKQTNKKTCTVMSTKSFRLRIGNKTRESILGDPDNST